MSLSEGAAERMRATNELFSDAIRRRDFELLRDVYTEDARVLPPGADLVEGFAAIQAFWTEAILGLEVQDATLTTIVAEEAGDGAVEIGRAALTLASGVVVPTKYVVHWKQVGDTWKWQTDIWNMNV